MEIFSLIADNFKNSISDTVYRKLISAYKIAKESNLNKEKNYYSYVSNLIPFLFNFHPDPQTIMAVFLHGPVKYAELQPKVVVKKFGQAVMDLIEGILRVENLDFVFEDEQDQENCRRYFLVKAKDLRVVRIKLAMVLYYLESVNTLKKDKQKEIAKYALNIYAPIAARTGMYEVKSKLEDLGFYYLYPNEYYEIVQEVQLKEKDRKTDVEIMERMLKEILDKERIKAEVTGRVKHYYGIYSKLKRKGRSGLDDIMDFFALRIVLNDVIRNNEHFFGHCYNVLGILYNYFSPIPDRFKDYIVTPKPNGYRSLHTTIKGFDLEGKVDTPVEIQIRTKKMDEESKFGVAAHWLYNFSKSYSVNFNHKNEEVKAYLKQQMDWIENMKKAEVKGEYTLELFHDKIFVFYEDNKVYELPLNATPVDLAYLVDSNLGHSCVSAKVNSKIVPLDYELQTGDRVEIIKKNSLNPNRYWLSFVKTENAKFEIQKYYEKLEKERNIHEAKIILESYLQRNKRLRNDKKFASGIDPKMRKTFYENNKELLEKLGRGLLSVRDLMDKMFAYFEKKIDLQEVEKENRFQPSVNHVIDKKSILVEGLKDIPIRIASCCRPNPGEKIAGYITRGKGITVHKDECNVFRSLESERFLNVTWEADNKDNYMFLYSLDFKCEKSFFILDKILKFLLDNNLDVRNVEAYEEDKIIKNYRLRLSMSEKDAEKVKNYFGKIDNVLQFSVIKQN